MFQEQRIYIASSLNRVIKEEQEKKKKAVKLPKYEFPANVVTAARLNRCVGGDDMMIPAKECYPIRKLVNMKQGLFGCGFLISDVQAVQIAQAVLN